MTTPPRPDQQQDPPVQVISPGGMSGVFRGREIIINGVIAPPGSGIFVYDNSGALIGAWVGANGTDPLDGGAVSIGLTVQNPSATVVTNLQSGALTMQRLSGVFAPPQIIITDATVLAGTASDTTINAAGIVTPIIQAVTPGDNTGGAETWHDLTTMSAGWAIGGHAAYTMLPNGWLGVAFKDLTPGTDTDGTVIFSAANGLPAAYRPANNHRVACYTNILRAGGSTAEAAALEFETDGSIQCFGVAAAATRLDLYAAIPLDDS